MDSIVLGLLKKLNRKIDSIETVPDEKIVDAVNEYLDKNPVSPGATKDQAEQIEKNTGDISELKSDIEQLKKGGGTETGIGATTSQANSLWAIIKKTAFAEILTEEELNAFKFAWDVGIEKYTITRNLVGCTSSSNVTSINEGSTHSETLTADEGYTLEGATVSVTMENTDISDKYNNGCLTIDNVTGNIIITVSAIIDDTNNLVILNGNTVKNSTASSTELNSDNSITVTGDGKYGYLLINGLTAGKNYILTIDEGGDISIYGNKTENAIDDSGFASLYHSKDRYANICPFSFSLKDGDYGIIIYLYGTNTFRNIVLVEVE